MATLDECRTAIETLGQRLASAGNDLRSQVLERSVSCRLTDLDVTLFAQLGADGLTGITEDAPAEPAQIRLTMTSDDLVALVDGELDFTRSWASGRIKLEASVLDLLRLRSLLS